MVQPRGKYLFNREKLELFWSIYNKEIEEDGLCTFECFENMT